MLVDFADDVLTTHEFLVSVKWNHESRFCLNRRGYFERISGIESVSSPPAYSVSVRSNGPEMEERNQHESCITFMIHLQPRDPMRDPQHFIAYLSKIIFDC